MEFDLLPPIGAGPVQIGAPLSEVESVLRAQPGFMPPDPLRPRRSGLLTFVSGLSIALHANSAGNVVAMEFYKPASDSDEVRFQGIDVFGVPAEEVMAFLESRTRIQVEEEGHTVIAPDLPMSLWRGTLPDSPEDDDGRYFESVLIARPGYFAAPGS